MRGEPLKFAKRYALVGEDEYKRLLSSGAKRMETAAGFLEDVNVKNARDNRQRIAESIDNPFTNDEQKLQEHARLLQKYLGDLQKIKQKQEEKRPATAKELYDLLQNKQDPSVLAVKRSPKATKSKLVVSKVKKATPMAARRLKSHNKSPTGKRLQAFATGKRGVTTRQQAEKFLADADIYQNKTSKKKSRSSLNTPVMRRVAPRKRIELSDDLVLDPPDDFSTPLTVTGSDRRADNSDEDASTLRETLWDYISNMSA